MPEPQLLVPASRLDQEYLSIQDEVDEAIAGVVKRAVFKPHVEVASFEQEFARYVGVQHAIGVSSGSIAVMVALMALGDRPDDEVISVPNVDISASAPITRAGARAVWVDIDPRTYNLDVEQLEEEITRRTRAIVAVHMYGNPANMDRILEIADRYAVPVVEDAALAHGATYAGRKTGSLGNIACFSFCPGKILGAFGQAGIVVTNEADLAQRVRVLANYGFQPSSIDAVRRGKIGARFEYLVEGFNATMDELQAAVLRVKLRHLDGWIRRRRENARIYFEMLSDLEPEYLLLPRDTPESEPVYRSFVIRSSQRDRLMTHLAEHGIWSGLAYVPPLHVQPVYEYLGYTPGSFPQTELVARELLCLPTAPQLSREEIELVGTTIREFFLRRN